MRDVYYNGCPRREKAAALLRISQTWFRFGSLEILANTGEIAVLKQLADFIIKVPGYLHSVTFGIEQNDKDGNKYAHVCYPQALLTCSQILENILGDGQRYVLNDIDT